MDDYSLALKIINLLTFLSEMNKILILIANLLFCIGVADAAVRDGTAISRSKTNATSASQPGQSRKSSTVRRTTTPRTTALVPRNILTTSRSAISGRIGANTPTSRTAQPRQRATTSTSVISRAATDTKSTAMSMTQTGAEYEQCKNTYFSCMDQFCTLKNDDYRRCSCNDRVFDLAAVRDVLQQAGEKLTVFTENLDVVGMTAAQAKSMRTETEGETALTKDNSASKALLQAIMNSIRGEDSSVGGKYSDLNSISISFDTVNAFGTVDAGQAIAAYNGNALYNAVYPQCRNAVRADCNDASLQRAITAYLMAIEQDCNTVQTAIEQTQKNMKSAVREGSAMLDLARIENRQKHNSSDITTCINEVESAILSEQVCGENYHKCLDNGEFIDISTGAPITGVEDFYKLEKMLVFSDGVEAANQKLAKNPSNRVFVQSFENRTKKFALPALDKCTEKADFVWSEYLDKAMLDIYYAQRAKVSEIKQGCFDYISACYVNGDKAITSAMSKLTGDSAVLLQPDKIALNSQMCSDYINSCNNMFDNNIIAEYINTQQATDTLAACRAVVKQCFDNYGGTNYENFYYPYSGLFKADSEFAPDWFTLYEHKTDGTTELKSECAKQLKDIAACSDEKMIENAFGGFDSYPAIKSTDRYYYQKNNADETTGPTGTTGTTGTTETTETYTIYGLAKDEPVMNNDGKPVKINGKDIYAIDHRYTRSTGVATEVYNQIISILTTQCTNLQGRFIEIQYIKNNTYDPDNLCLAQFGTSNDGPYAALVEKYDIIENENMCPRDYNLSVATQSWGACLCWENGGRRSKFGKSAKCVAALPVAPKVTKDKTTGKIISTTYATDMDCDKWIASLKKTETDGSETGTDGSGTGTDGSETGTNDTTTTQMTFDKTLDIDSWCTQTQITNQNQVCPIGYKNTEPDNTSGQPNTDGKTVCTGGSDTIIGIPEGIE